MHRALILAGGITVFWLIESAVPFIRFNYNKWQHARINIFFTLTTIIVNFVLAFFLLKTANWTTENQFGILNWLPAINPWLFALIGLLILDLVGAYLVHLVEHKVKFLWRFHLIHHTDTWIDTTSANRHHPGESVIRFIFTILAVLIVGAPMWMVFLYQTLSVIATQFNHANIVLPKKLDVLLSYFIVSPDMHKVHHRFGALRGRGLESTNFQFSTNVAKPFFYLLIYTFQANKKWFLRNRSTKVEFST